MMMYYTPSEEAYVAAQAAYETQMLNHPPKMIEAPMTELPDMNEAERLWQLIKLSAESSR